MSDGVKVTNLSAFDAQVDAWFAAVEKAATEAAVGLAREAFEQIIENGPQNSGDFVAQTKVSVGAPAPVSDFEPFQLHNKANDPFQMGDSPAMEYAKSHAVWPTIKLGQTVFISSSAKHDEFYAWKIEKGQIKLRPENAGAVAIYARAARHVGHRYNFIGGVQMDWLRKMGT